MEDWVLRALERWPNVPALYGWLSLDARGHWRIKDETISRPQIVHTINRNYAADEHGRWYFQNGPQRGYVALARAPLILWVDGSGRLHTHTGQMVNSAQAGYLDQDGGLWLVTEYGPAALDPGDLNWLLEHLECHGHPVTEPELLAALALPSGARTELALQLSEAVVALKRLDLDAAPAQLGFVREPKPAPGERTAGSAD